MSSAGLIYKKILAVMGEIDAIAKSRDNKQQGFKETFHDEVSFRCGLGPSGGRTPGGQFSLSRI